MGAESIHKKEPLPIPRLEGALADVFRSQSGREEKIGKILKAIHESVNLFDVTKLEKIEKAFVRIAEILIELDSGDCTEEQTRQYEVELQVLVRDVPDEYNIKKAVQLAVRKLDV